MFLSCPYPCTNVTILHKNPTNVFMYVNTTSFTLLHFYNFHPSRAHLEGVLIQLLNQFNKIAVSSKHSSFYHTENTLLFQYKYQSLNAA